jgi:hypothetical protein
LKIQLKICVQFEIHSGIMLTAGTKVNTWLSELHLWLCRIHIKCARIRVSLHVRQCMYNVILRRVRVTNVAVEKQ